MKTFIQPYLFFGGHCEEAIQFYQTALGAVVEMMMKFSESPDPVPPGMLEAGFENKIMHTSFRIGETTLMASDGCGSDEVVSGFTLSLTVPSKDEADRAFQALAEGGTVKMPLGQTFWSPYFGMVTDKFGLSWMITLPVPNPCA